VQTQHRSEVLCDVEWRGHAVPVRPGRVRGFLLSEQQLDTSLGRAVDNAAKIALLETLLMDCKDAIAAVRDELKTDTVSKCSVPLQMPHKERFLFYLD
jgi:signal recognition particle subunit SRP68